MATQEQQNLLEPFLCPSVGRILRSAIGFSARGLRARRWRAASTRRQRGLILFMRRRGCMIGFALCRRGSRGADDRRVLRDTCEFGRHVLRRQDEVHGACGHSTAWHRVVAGGVVLREGNAPLSLDGLQAHRAVGGGAGKNHPDGTVALIARQRLEKEIDRPIRCPRLGAGTRVNTPSVMLKLVLGGMTYT